MTILFHVSDRQVELQCLRSVELRGGMISLAERGGMGIYGDQSCKDGFSPDKLVKNILAFSSAIAR